jgi:OmpA-OmpF porin, OOP family
MRPRLFLTRALSVGCVCAALLVTAAAQEPGDPDAEGCKDLPILSRMPGCTITECGAKEYDAAELQSGPLDDATGELPKKSLEGQIETVTYICPTKLSLLQIHRNAETALKAAGYETVFSGKAWHEERMVTVRKGARWVQVKVEPWNEYTSYELTSVTEKGMAQEMEATAEQMAAEISRTGHVAVYGVTFDTGSAKIKPESDKVLGEIASLLRKNPAWKMRLEGHTDDVGGKAANQKLSEQRAAAVVTWLTGHGIAPDRLTSQGFGDGKPVGDNKTEEGRAKNRRVELVKL